jgi:hypothetical protein
MAGIRRFSLWSRVVLTGIFLIGIVVQFIAAGYGFFEGDFDLHEGLGYTVMHGIPLLILVASLGVWRGGTSLWLALALGALGIAQPFLAAAGGWAGVFHPLAALVLSYLGVLLLRVDWAALRAPALPAPAT